MKIEEMPTTEQGVFDHVVEHLRKQNAKSSTPATRGGGTIERCLYRSPDGLMCAAGCLIPDELYSVAFEDTTIEDLFCSNFQRVPEEQVLDAESKASRLSQVYKPHLQLITRLQELHDDAPVSSWEDHFARIADKYELEYVGPK